MTGNNRGLAADSKAAIAKPTCATRARLYGAASLAALSFAAFPALASAQTAPASAVAPVARLAADNSDTRTSAPDIIITAQRREQRLQVAPVAVTALSSSALTDLNVQNAQSLMQVVPGLQVTTQSAGDGGGSATFFIRGQGQQRVGNGTEPAVGIYVDDFYYPSLYGSLFDIVDLSQVEVLRGPQGTLFGRNTIGGAIRYTTKRPELSTFSGHIEGTFGSFARRDFSGAFNIPLGDIAALHVTAGHLQRDGFVRIQATGQEAGRTETTLVRGQLRIEPASNFSIDLSSTYSKLKLDGQTYDVPGPLTPRPPAPGGSPTLPFIYNVSVAPLLGLPLYTDAFKSTCFYCQYGTSTPEFSRTTYKNLFATAAWNVTPNFTIKSLTGYQDVRNRYQFDLDSTPLPVFGGTITHEYTKALSQELQLSGKLLDSRLNFVGGLYYYRERLNRGGDAPTILLGQPLPLTADQRNLNSYAAFIDATFKITDKFSLIGGYRYSEDHRTVTTVSVPSGTQLASAKATFPSNTFRAGAQYFWTPDVNTYFTLSTGFRAGGFNSFTATLANQLPAFGPEKATSYEFGTRIQFLNRRFTINPTLFYVDWDHIQVQAVSISPVNGDAVVTVQNAGKARSYGGEVEASASVTPSLRLFGNMALLNIRYTSIGNATGITLNSRFEHAPPLSYSVGAAYTLHLGGGNRLISTLNYSFQDKQASTPTDPTTLLLKGYGVLNARIELRSKGERFSLAGFVTNLTDEHYAIGGVNYYNDVGAARYDLGRPREFGVSARVGF